MKVNEATVEEAIKYGQKSKEDIAEAINIYVMHRQDRLLLSQLHLTSLQFGWNKELKGSNWSHPSELINRTPPSKLDTTPFWHVKPQPIRGFPATEPVTF